jgi:hypothetical protein
MRSAALGFRSDRDDGLSDLVAFACLLGLELEAPASAVLRSLKI